VLREGYIRAARAVRRQADRAGITGWLARRPGRGAFYLRSLLAIYDVDAMLELDTPWWTFRAIDRVDHFLATERGGTARVFEFGAGASTPWLARRSAEVHAVESDAGFAAHIDPVVRDAGATLHVVPGVPSARPRVPSSKRGHGGVDFEEYVATIDKVGGAFDLVVIDGRAREEALVRSLPHLAPGGLVLLDDAWRTRYRAALGRVPATEVTWLWGLAPSLPYPSCSALLARAGS
jgi:Methyltransferase domain